MRIFSNVIDTRSVFHVSGTTDFPGEICDRINKLFWGSVVPTPDEKTRHYNLIWQVVYEGDPKGKGEVAFTSAEYRMLVEFREWLKRVETRQAFSEDSVFVVMNLNDGLSLAFVAVE